MPNKKTPITGDNILMEGPSRMGEWFNKRVTKPVVKGYDTAVRPWPNRLGGAVVGAPGWYAKNVAMNTLVGRKARMGSQRGSRMRKVPGGPGRGMKRISSEEASKMRSGKLPGKVIEGKIGGRTYYFRRKLRPGGLLGVAARNPGKTSLAALAAYYLAKNPEARGVGRSAVINMRPTGQFSPEMMERFKSKPSQENPFAREAWSP